jgi:hypothetical protein
MIPQTRKYTIGLSGMLAAVVVVLAASVPANQAQAKQWACGPVNEYTCYDQPCKAGDSTSTDSNAGTTHCVGDKKGTARPVKDGKTPAKVDKKNAPAVR